MHTNALLRITLISAALSTAFGSAAGAEKAAAAKEVGHIARITGSALVNKGERYIDGAEGMPLSRGDRVMSLADSTAILQFNDGCRYTMKENELVTVPSVSPCVLTKGPRDRLSVAVLPPVPLLQAVVPAVIPVAGASGLGLAGVPVAAAGVLGAAAIIDNGGDVSPRPAISP